jgi:hypothetical protein
MSTTRFNDAEMLKLGFSRASIEMLREVYRRSSATTSGGVTLDQVDTLLGDVRRILQSTPDLRVRVSQLEERIADLEQLVGAR